MIPDQICGIATDIMGAFEIFFVGVLVGIVCVGGLALGMRWLIKSRDERYSAGARQKFGLLGVAALVGQFVCAGLILWAVPGLTEEPLALATGLLSMNLILPIFAGRWFRKSHKTPNTLDSSAESSSD